MSGGEALEGILAAVLTPFRSASTEVDYGLLETQIDWLVDEARCDGLVVAGVETQEYQVLTEAERLELVKRTVDAAGGRAPTIVGVTTASVDRSLALIDEVIDLGADVVLALAALKPWGGVPTESEIIDQFTMLSEHSPVPLLVYNNPRFGVDVPVHTMLRLAELDNVKYFKETSRDIRKIGRLLVDIDAAGLARYFTTMEALLFTLQMGGPGAMMPPPAVLIASRLVEAFRTGDQRRAVELQQLFTHFPDDWMRLGLLPAMKAAMRAVGLDAGEPVRPWEALTDDEVRSMASLLRGELDLAEGVGEVSG